MLTSITTVALAMVKQRLEAKQAYERFSGRDREMQLNMIKQHLLGYEAFLTSAKALPALEEKASILPVDPVALRQKLMFVSAVIRFEIMRNRLNTFSSGWLDAIYNKLPKHHVFKNEDDFILTEEINSLATYFNLKTDEYLQAACQIEEEYYTLIGQFRNSSSSTYVTDSSNWWYLFTEGLKDFLDVAEKNDFKTDELSSELDKILLSERFRLTIQGIEATESQTKTTFAAAFDDDVKNFSKTGKYSHTLSNGQVALFVTIENLGDNEAALYKNGQSQYWRLGSLITI